ncbi:hypothetical protein IMCC1989_110 [gamma proteobacterium IMCC1989]|nr:hypothetical protein IMCC1989_110 [gamma proteobacterium IMCC1989]
MSNAEAIFAYQLYLHIVFSLFMQGVNKSLRWKQYLTLGFP